MTCIIALKTEFGFVMGCDSAGTDMTTYGSITTPKMFRLEEFVIGYTSSFRFGKLLQYSLSIPKREKDIDDDAYINGPFAEAVRICLADGGYTIIKDNSERGGFALVGYRGRVWDLQNDFSLVEYTTDVVAEGSGEVAAIAAATALKRHTKKKPEEIVKAALQIVEDTILTVKGPFLVLNGYFTPDEEKNNES